MPREVTRARGKTIVGVQQYTAFHMVQRMIQNLFALEVHNDLSLRAGKRVFLSHQGCTVEFPLWNHPLWNIPVTE